MRRSKSSLVGVANVLTAGRGGSGLSLVALDPMPGAGPAPCRGITWTVRQLAAPYFAGRATAISMPVWPAVAARAPRSGGHLRGGIAGEAALVIPGGVCAPKGIPILSSTHIACGKRVATVSMPYLAGAFAEPRQRRPMTSRPPAQLPLVAISAPPQGGGDPLQPASASLTPLTRFP